MSFFVVLVFFLELLLVVILLISVVFLLSSLQFNFTVLRDQLYQAPSSRTNQSNNKNPCGQVKYSLLCCPRPCLCTCPSDRSVYKLQKCSDEKYKAAYGLIDLFWESDSRQWKTSHALNISMFRVGMVGYQCIREAFLRR